MMKSATAVKAKIKKQLLCRCIRMGGCNRKHENIKNNG